MPEALAARVCAGRSDGHLLALAPDGRLDVGRTRTLAPSAAIDRDATVLVSIGATLPLIETLLALDGHVAGLLLVSASAAPDVVAALAAAAGAALVIADRDDLPGALPPAAVLGPGDTDPPADRETVWMMTTSGTTGIPKIVPHTLASLARTVRRDATAAITMTSTSKSADEAITRCASRAPAVAASACRGGSPCC